MENEIRRDGQVLSLNSFQTELRAAPNLKIKGKIFTNSLSQDMGDWYEKIRPGAFSESIKNRNIYLLWQHDHKNPLANTKSGTLRIWEVKDGFEFEAGLPDTQMGKDVHELVSTGVVTGTSFAMSGIVDSWAEENGNSVRYIESAVLHEISPVTWPAYESAYVVARSKTNSEEIRKYESFFNRDVKENFEEMRQREIKDFWRTGGNYKNLRDEFQAIKTVAELNIPDDRLRASGLSEGVSSEGGFLLRPDFSRKLLEGPDVSPIWAGCFKIPLGPVNYSIKIPTWQEDDRQAASFLGGLRFYFEKESAEIVQSNIKFSGLDMNLWKSTCLVPFTDEIFQDAEGFEIIMRAGIQKALNYMLEDKIINGTGVGEPLGLLNAGCKITVPKESGQDASTLLAANIENMILHTDPNFIYDYVWLASGTNQQQLAKLNTVVGTAGIPSPLFRYRAGGEKYDKLAGRDILYTSHCPNLGTEGDLILANLKQMICTYKEQKRVISIHVRFLQGEEMYKVVWRWNAQPAVAKAITPVKNGAKISPVITLATR